MSNPFDNYWSSRISTKVISKTKLADIYVKIVSLFPNINKKWNIILNLPQNAKILDVGCGSGSFFRMVHRFRPDIELYGIDISTDGFKQIKIAGVTLKKSAGDSIPFEDDLFDLVNCQHVIEYTDRPDLIIKEIKRVTKKDLLIVAPNHLNLFLWDKHNFYMDFTHKIPITKAIIEQIARQVDLKIIYLKHRRYNDLPFPLFLCTLPIFIYRNDLGGFLADLIFKRATVAILRKQ